VLASCPYVNGLLDVSSRAALSPNRLWEIRRLLAAERRAAGPFDLALDFQGTRRSAAWVYLSGARIKAGRGSPRPGWRATLTIDRRRHAVRDYADVCESVGVEASRFDPTLHTAPQDEAALDTILDCLRIPRRGFVLFNPFSVWPSKSWDQARAADLATRVAADTGTALVLTGGREEREPADTVVSLAHPGSAVSLAGRLALGEALCLFGRARLMISCDSGPMHAAAAMGTPVVALFGPTLPEHTGPWGTGHTVVQSARPPDHHTYRRDPARRYMNALGIEDVAAAVSTALRATAPRAAATR
jgi:heptosyltransferase I